MTSAGQPSKRDKQALIIGALLIILVGVYFIGKSFYHSSVPSEKSAFLPADTAKTAPLMTPEVMWKKIQNGDQLALIDIRDSASFESEHIASATNIPIGALENFVPNQDEALVIIYSPADTQIFDTAKNILAQKSFPYFFLQGGFEAWKNFSAPTISSGNPNSFIDQSKVTYIGIDAFKKLLGAQGAAVFILDVQTADKFQKKHIKGATNIPLDLLEKRRADIPAGRPIVVYGENDTLSFQGGVRLADLGVYAVQTLNGNTYLSPASGLPLEP
jgi:rhodanese-related sulfurtransferase